MPQAALAVFCQAPIEQFPELAPRLPRFRKLWMSEDERMSIFDALSLALALLEEEARKRRSQEQVQAA